MLNFVSDAAVLDKYKFKVAPMFRIHSIRLNVITNASAFKRIEMKRSV